MGKKVKVEAAPKQPKDFSKLTGILMLFVIASAVYAIYVVAMGTVGYIPKAMLIPLGAWVVVELVKRFTK